MVQEVKGRDVWGTVGKGFGQGLGDQLNKEIDRKRLSKGLETLGKQEGLTPFERFSQLSAIPGITPQMIQSGTELLRQEARGKSLSKAGKEQPKSNPFKGRENIPNTKPGSEIPSLTTEDTFANAQEGFIPRTEEEKFEAAGKEFNADPDKYGGDAQNAIDYQNRVEATNQAIADAYQKKHENLSAIQDNVVKRLDSQYTKLKGNVPADLYSRVEDDAIQATKPRSEGGDGLTEQQAMKKYGDKLNEASKVFSSIDQIGDWGISLRPASETLRSMKHVQNEMKKLGETDNYAKLLISNNKLSPRMAYSIAQPVSQVAELNKAIKNLPELEKFETIAESKVPPTVSIPATLEIAPRLAKFIKENEDASPQAIAYELDKRGYNGDAFLKYVTDHKDELNLRQRQSDQSSTPSNIVTPWNDWWLSSFTGIE